MSIAVVGVVASLAATAMAAYSSYEQGKTQKDAYDYNARVNEQNAKAVREKSILDEEQSRERTKRLIGHQRTLYAKAGVDLSSGSPLLNFAETAAEGEEEAMAIRAGGNVGANQELNQATLNRFYGQNAKTAGSIGAASTFLSGLGQAGTAYAQGEKGFTSGMRIKSPYSGRGR
jgi:hypothetical protein